MQMNRTAVLFCLALAIAGKGLAADTLSYRIKEINNWAFYGNQSPQVGIVAGNSRGVPQKFHITCTVRDYNNRPLYELSQSGDVAPKDSSGMEYAFKAMHPGVYRVEFSDRGRYVNGLNIAYEPQKILPDSTLLKKGAGSFTKIADLASLERREKNPQFTIARNKAMSGREKNVYDFRMVSRGDEAITGYVAFPKGKKNLAAMLTLIMHGEQSANPLADFTAGANMVELVVYLKERGEGEEYFKNLFTDIIYCMDFLQGRSEIDKERVYVQGSGRGAACAFVASALDERVAVSFVADPQMDKFTSNFTIESLTCRISSPVLMGMALQAPVYSLNENFALYNKVMPVKEYFVFPAMGEVDRKQWRYIRDTFLLRIGK